MVPNNQYDPSSSTHRFLRLPEVMRLCGLGRSAIYAKIKSGEFPAPISLGARAVAWTSDSISAWMDARIESSRSMKGGC